MKKPFLKAVSLFISVLFVFQNMAFAAEEILFYHTDPVGTPLAMSNMSGQKVWEADYKPFGEEFSTGGSKGNSKRFVGKEKDAETGLNYFGARYLSGPSGRFLAPDPVRAVDVGSGQINYSLLGDPQRQNVYTYAINNSSRYFDPDGKQVYLVSRRLAIIGVGRGGVHTYILILPDKPADFNGEKKWTLSAFSKNGKLASGKNWVDDLGWNAKDTKQINLIPTPPGKTDSEFIADIMKEHASYKSESRVYKPFPNVKNNEGNCNNYTTGLLVGGGVGAKYVEKLNPTGLNPGLGKPLNK